ncbi:MAG: hypothetical protein NC489_20190 [Ruminococcus flavefaciens]|nr:hypothetical protein [Ruminococcus flavefaciens]
MRKRRKSITEKLCKIKQNRNREQHKWIAGKKVNQEWVGMELRVGELWS